MAGHVELMEVISNINDRMLDESSKPMSMRESLNVHIHLVATETYTAIVCSDVVLWDDEDNHPECPGCELAGGHDCLRDSTKAIQAHIEAGLRSMVKELLALAGDL